MVNGGRKRMFIMEGKSDVMFLLGLMGVKETKKRKVNEFKYECYAVDGGTYVCNGNGKDQACKMAEELLEEGGSMDIHVVLDGDAANLKCGDADMHHLNHLNLDELVFDLVETMLHGHCDDEFTVNLLNAERSNKDSKKKAYLAMYLAWKFREKLGIGNAKYWTDISSFYHCLGSISSELIPELDKGLDNVINLLRD
ncbi:hypothetical protein GCM10007981_03500 [Thermocladium modestius]|uniref:DUF4435 domain-containing protein n=1 Tax=Thermocladium modestius TaxID=62609 RepID=A0A830GSE7_9CREN|nr:hypothetical protein [Thermocladium modestius]GGP19513.1 hypothetical protein GCM10007981_03500 [Thermocladium modestius]